MRTPDTFRAELQTVGLGHHADRLITRGRNSIRLVNNGTEGDRIGGSRIGGAPDVPADFEWPTYQGLPMAFIAQFDLAEMAAYDVEAKLPRTGVLAFFYEAEEMVWGFDPADAGGAKVVHFPDAGALWRAELPEALNEADRFRPIGLIASTEWTPPAWESWDAQSLRVAPDELSAYGEMLASESDDVLIHRLLGNPEPVQGDMQLECQLVTHGLYCGDASGYQEPRAASLEPGAADWILLCQIDSEEDATDMMWGDSGRLYWWIREADLAAQAWDSAWLILQCG